jgi:1-acyl-sn-glycerol-3-phosphate acyltransferase
LAVTVTLAAHPNPLEGLYMARRPLSFVGAESSERITAIQIALAQLLDVDVDRKKRIDDAIDYFGTGRIAVARKGVRQLRVAPESSRLGMNKSRHCRYLRRLSNFDHTSERD